jgi:hypothetical protein
MSRTAALDQLQQVHELNRAFLGLLQSRVRQQRGCLELPSGARAVIGAAPGALLDSVACFPRALFELRVGARAPLRPDGGDLDDAERELCLSVLLAARATSRHSVYQARLLLGLDAAAIDRLAAAQLSDLQQIACVPGTLRCAFRERSWFWHGLLTATRPEVRRQLTLMALQPAIVLGWPRRRPPQLSA